MQTRRRRERVERDCAGEAAVGVLTAVVKRDATIAATQLRRCRIAVMITDGCLTTSGAGIGAKRAAIVSDCG